MDRGAWQAAVDGVAESDTGDLLNTHWVGKIPWRRKWLHTSVFLPEKPQGQRSLAGYNSPWGHKESDTTEKLTLSLQTYWLLLFCLIRSNPTSKIIGTFGCANCTFNNTQESNSIEIKMKSTSVSPKMSLSTNFRTQGILWGALALRIWWEGILIWGRSLTKGPFKTVALGPQWFCLTVSPKPRTPGGQTQRSHFLSVTREYVSDSCHWTINLQNEISITKHVFSWARTLSHHLELLLDTNNIYFFHS